MVKLTVDEGLNDVATSQLLAFHLIERLAVEISRGFARNLTGGILALHPESVGASVRDRIAEHVRVLFVCTTTT